ncbi:MAG: carboxypeptidase M32 [Verrucomicrobiota bacterium]|nr:carboxypeptidase M32 [Verrucomicrobiota bacterium]
MLSTTTYTSLVTDLNRIAQLEHTLGLLGWDEQVNLPSGSAESSASQQSALADIIHREATRPQIGEWLNQLESLSGELTHEQQIVVREARRDYDQGVKIPAEFIARRATLHSNAYHAWVEARAESNFAKYAPFLSANLEMAKEQAGYLGKSDSEAYDYFIDLHDPGLDAAFVEKQFAELKAELVPLVQQITSAPIKGDSHLLKGFPVDKQEQFLRETVAAIGFDFTKGRIDRAVHPFCGGHTGDTRLTTRFDENNPLDSWSSAMHETGHGLYQQGLPANHPGTALGKHVGMAVHESQSRLWENQVGRSRAYWQYWEPRYRTLFPEQLKAITSDQLYLAINTVEISPIRVDADEVTYNLHILLRFEIEKLLFQGKLAVKDLPSAWNQLSKEILGYTPTSDKQGCLQDVHWAGGSFGYFPSYCLGNMMAAQLWYTVRKAIPDLDSQIAHNDFQPLLKWLRTNIHVHGRREDTRAITRRVTGEELGPQSLIRYLKERYLPLYIKS